MVLIASIQVYVPSQIKADVRTVEAVHGEWVHYQNHRSNTTRVVISLCLFFLELLSKSYCYQRILTSYADTTNANLFLDHK